MFIVCNPKLKLHQASFACILVRFQKTKGIAETFIVEYRPSQQGNQILAMQFLLSVPAIQ